MLKEGIKIQLFIYLDDAPNNPTTHICIFLGTLLTVSCISYIVGSSFHLLFSFTNVSWTSAQLTLQFGKSVNLQRCRPQLYKNLLNVLTTETIKVCLFKKTLYMSMYVYKRLLKAMADSAISLNRGLWGNKLSDFFQGTARYLINLC